MKLLKLQLVNIATYSNTTLDFSKLSYPVFVTGENGAGKTTLFVDAITAALFGFAYGSGNLLREFLMKGKSTGKIILEFEIDTHNGKKRYRIERIIRASGSNEVRLIEIGGSKILTGKQVEDFIQNILGWKAKMMLNSAIVRQGGVEEFLEMSASDRREVLQDILRIDMKKYKEEAKKRANRLENEKENLEGRIQTLRDRLKEKANIEKELSSAISQKPNIKNHIDELKSQIKDYKDLLNTLTQQIGEYEEKKKFIDEQRKKLRELKIQYEKTVREIKNIETLKQKLPPNIIDNLGHYQELLIELKDTEVDLTKQQQNLETIEEYERKKRHLERLKESIKNAEVIKEQLETLNSKIKEAEKEKSALEAEIKQLNKAINELKAAGDTCPICGSPLPKDRKEERLHQLNLDIRRRENKIRQLDQEIASLSEELKKIRLRYESLQHDIGEYKALEIELKRSEVDLSQKNIIKNKIQSLLDKKNQILNELKEVFGTTDRKKIQLILQNAVELKTKLEKLELLYEMRNTLEREISEREQVINTSSNIIETLTKLKSKKEQVSGKLTRYERELNYYSELLGKLDEKIKNLREKLEELKEVEKEIRSLEEKRRVLEMDIRAYRLLEQQVFSEGGLPAILLKDYLDVISELANRYLQHVFGLNISIYLILNKTKRKGKIIYTIEISAYANGEKRNIKTFSGGERTLIGFAIRLAIGNLVAALSGSSIRPRFLIIDEGFGSLDENKRNIVAEAIGALASTIDDRTNTPQYEQIIVISHQQDLRHHPVFRSVIKVTKSGGESKVSIELPTSQTVYPSS